MKSGFDLFLLCRPWLFEPGAIMLQLSLVDSGDSFQAAIGKDFFILIQQAFCVKTVNQFVITF
jgi:hypothetical protein